MKLLERHDCGQICSTPVRGVDDGVKTGVSAANPGNTALIDVRAREAGDGPIVIIPGLPAATRAPIRLVSLTPGFAAHPGLYAIVRSADWLAYATASIRGG